MSDPLTVYLHDHESGATGAIELLEAVSEQYQGEPLGDFAGELLEEIQSDERLLEEIADRVGARTSPVKNAAGWLVEKLSRLKLGRDSAGELGTFQALELLGLGILGKRALWKALATQSERFADIDFEALTSRAQDQYDRVEERRLQLARTALRLPRE